MHLFRKKKQEQKQPSPVAPALPRQVPAGHFYSPVPNLAEVRQDRQRIFNYQVPETPGVDLNDEGQKRMLEDLAKVYPGIPFKPEKQPRLRYYFENEYYAYFDGVMLYCMMKHLAPSRYIEIGSGFSSCVALDTDELFLERSTEFTFIEPFPERLKSLISEDDRRITIHEKRLQDIDLSVFETLKTGDILFVDSTHVSKTGSDVNMIIFDILPLLASGVYVHIHDIFFPFEYPESWILEGCAWNEDYIVRAFLQYNSRFDIVLFNSYASYFHRDFIVKNLPLALDAGDSGKSFVGGGLWLRKR
ncbi:MAG: class I SAM-dependent methyltransferase [Candidatus Dojkabacteria bacterium]|nr:class I SAM-dependent methyltransferase [Candidatus Dojkabacteria bacterium]